MTQNRAQIASIPMVFASSKIASVVIQIRMLTAWVTKFLLSFFILTNLFGCNASVYEKWSSGLLESHRLVGQIWDVRNQQFVDIDDFLQSLNVPYLLLGEKHDNPDHHRLQSLIVDHQLKQTSVDGVVFEMLDSNFRPVPALTDEPLNMDELKNRIGWEDDGWYWPFYEPLIKSAYNQDARILPGNLSDQEVSGIYASQDFESPDALSEASLARLTKDIDESHCGMLPKSQFPSMLRVQRARDARMAEELTSNNYTGQMLLIAGNYHVRHDLGVPNYLIKGSSETVRDDIVSVAFLEVSVAKQKATDYEDGVAFEKAWDFIWFTPAVTSKDYCAQFKAGPTDN